MISPLTPSALIARRSPCAPRFFGSYRTTTETCCPAGMTPLEGVVLKNLILGAVKSTGISLFVFLIVTRWSPTSSDAIGPKSNSGGSTARIEFFVPSGFLL
eukprot:31424-Pelagococcus_subviridis.AAC.4